MNQKILDAWEQHFQATQTEDLATYESEGWMTTKAFAKKAGVAYNTARCLLEGPRFERKIINTITPDGVTRKVCIYRPIVTGIIS